MDELNFLVKQSSIKFQLKNLLCNPGFLTEGVIIARVENLYIMPLKYTEARINIDNNMAEVEINQKFYNDFPEKCDIVYLFPLPDNSRVISWSIDKGKEVNEEKEFVTGNFFALSSWEIIPGDEISVNLKYSHPVTYMDNKYVFTLPLKPVPFGTVYASPDGSQVSQAIFLLQSCERETDIFIKLKTSFPGGHVFSPGHKLYVYEKSPCEKEIHLVKTIDEEGNDFILKYTSNEYNHLLYIEEGDRLFYEEKYEKAMAVYEKVLKEKPDNEVSWIFRGLCLHYLNRPGESLMCYNRALKINSRSFLAWRSRGLAFNKMKKYKDAIKCYDMAIKINPSDRRAWNNKGVLLSSFRKYKESIKCYDRAISLNTNYHSAWNNKGISLYHMGKIKEACRCFSTALEIYPDFQDAKDNLDKALKKKWKNEGVKIWSL